MKKILIPLIALALTATAFTSCEDVPAPYSINYDESSKPGSEDEPTTEALNTQETAWTVAEAIQKIKDAEGGKVNGQAYVKGVITKVVGYNDKYKSITYNIVDKEGNADYIQVYSGKGLDGADFAAATDLNVGDQVVVLGNLMSYTNPNTGVTIMEVDKTSKIVSIIKAETPPAVADLNTEETAWTTDEAVAKIKEKNAKLDGQAYIKGVITEVWSKVNTDGTLSYYVKTEGNKDSIQVYNGFNKGGEKFTNPTDLKKGQKVVVKGFLMPYVKKDKETGAETTIYEMDKGSVIITITGSDTKPTTPVGAETVIEAKDFGDADLVNFTYTAPDGTKLVFAKSEGNNDPKYTKNWKAVRMYAKNEVTIESSKTIKQIILTTEKKNNGNDMAYAESGDNKVTITKVSDTEVQFNGLSSSKVKIVNDFTQNSKGTQLRIQVFKIVYAD